MQNKNTMIALSNLEKLRTNSYPGRIIIIGLNDEGTHLVQLYAIMGRSENSRNRIFVAENETGTLRTEAADPAKVKDPSLIIYAAMAEDQEERVYVVSNGSQTQDLLEEGNDLLLKKWKYEDDSPNFTPRIQAGIFLGDNSVYQAVISVLKKSPLSDECDFEEFNFKKLHSGFGHCIHTYDGDGNPLPSFSKVPYLMPLNGTKEEILNTYWEALNEENRISLAIKSIEIQTGKSEIFVINKYEPVKVEA